MFFEQHGGAKGMNENEDQIKGLLRPGHPASGARRLVGSRRHAESRTNNAARRATREIQRGDPSQCCQNTLTSDFPAMAFPPMKFIRSYKRRGGL